MARIFTERRDFRTLSQMSDYTVAHLYRFPVGTPAGDAAPLAVAAVLNLKARTAAQTTLANRIPELTRERNEAREDLRQEVESWYLTADGIAAEVPEFNVKFRVSLKGDSKLLNAARSAIEKAAPHADLFIKRAKPANFLEIMEQKIRRFEQAIEDSVNARNAFAMGPKELQAALDQTKRTWRGFDATVRNTLSGDRLALQAWKLASKLARPSKTKAETSSGENSNTESKSEAAG